MPVLSRVLSMGLRFGELVSASVVAGLVGKYIHDYDHTHDGWPKARFIYTEVIAAISILLSILWLLPFAGGIIHYVADFILAAAWFVSFGLLVNSLHHFGCGSAFHWGGIEHGGFCNRFKASEAFAFISAILWLVSMLVGMYFVHSKQEKYAATTTTTRRRWYRRHRV